MKKCFLIISIYLSLCLSVFASTKISIFIDISGSMYNSLPQIQEYLNNEYIPALETDTEVNIYKFYGKLITPPIYAGNLKNETNVRWAKKRINALKANGPWTNINAVFEYIKENCINYGDKFIVLTDCNNETEDGNNNYKFTDSMIKDKLDANISILPKGNWKVIEYTYEKPAIEKTQLNNENESANIIYQEKTVIKINWRVLLLIILILSLVFIIYLIFRLILIYCGVPMKIPFKKQIKNGVVHTLKRVQWSDGTVTNRFFPEFKFIYETKLPKEKRKIDDVGQFNYCNEKFKEKFNSNIIFKKRILRNVEELQKVFEKKGYEGWKTKEEAEKMFIDEVDKGHTPPGYVWHHSEKSPGSMELVRRDMHEKVSHEGGRNIWGGGSYCRK